MMISSLPPVPDDAAFARIERDLFAKIDATGTVRAAHHRLVAVGAAAVILAGTGGTAWVTLATQEMRSHTAYCYAQADANSRFTQVGSPSNATGSDGTPVSLSAPQDRFTAAVDNCAAVWSIGFFESATPPKDDGSTYAVPNLLACVRSDQVPAVFPRDRSDGLTDQEFCRDLGLELSSH